MLRTRMYKLMVVTLHRVLDDVGINLKGPNAVEIRLRMERMESDFDSFYHVRFAIFRVAGDQGVRLSNGEMAFIHCVMDVVDNFWKLMIKRYSRPGIRITGAATSLFVGDIDGFFRGLDPGSKSRSLYVLCPDMYEVGQDVAHSLILKNWFGNPKETH